MSAQAECIASGDIIELVFMIGARASANGKAQFLPFQNSQSNKVDGQRDNYGNSG